MSDTYFRGKFLTRLSQQQSILKSKINPEKYWGFIEHLQDYLKITGLDVDLRKIVVMGKTLFKINLEIYFEKTPQINYESLRKIFQLYFYEPHDVLYGQDFMFITMNEDIIQQSNLNPYYSSLGVHNVLPNSKRFE